MNKFISYRFYFILFNSVKINLYNFRIFFYKLFLGSLVRIVLIGLEYLIVAINYMIFIM